MRCICTKHVDKGIQYIAYIKLYNSNGCKYCGYERSGDKLRHDYEYIKNKFDDRGYELLETKYINNEVKMKYKCLKHPDEIQEIKYANLVSGNGCRFCGFEKISDIKKLDFNFVKDRFKEKGCFIEPGQQYTGNLQKLKYRCEKHPEYIQEASYTQIDTDVIPCNYCRTTKRTLDINMIKREFKEKNYILIEDVFVNSHTPMRYICLKHPDKKLTINYTHFHSGEGCKYCAYENNSGENCHLWKGGVTSENHKIRSSLEYKEWRKSVFERDNYICQCCDQVGNNLRAHHINNFHSHEDLRLDVNNGITLCDKCHDFKFNNSFHNIYGNRNNTKQQLDEYIEKYNNNEFVRLEVVI